MKVPRLGDVVEFAYGKSLPVRSRRNGSVPVYGSNGIVGWHDEALVGNNTVVVGRKGSAGSVHLTTSPSFPIDTTFFVRPRPGVELDPAYGFYALKHLNLGRLRTETGVPGLNRADAYREPFALPSLNEQQRVAAILNRAAKIERLNAGAAERFREFLPALFVRMFGDPVGNPMSWKVAELGKIGRLDRGRSRHRPRNAPELYGGPYPFVQTGDIANAGGMVRKATQSYSERGLQQSRMWPAGTLCITIAANIAETGILAFDACFPDSVVGFVPSEGCTTVEYVQCALDSMQSRIEENAPRAAQRNINLRILRALPLPVPPVDLQQRFSRVVQQARATEVFASAASQHVSLLTDSLMHRLL